MTAWMPNFATGESTTWSVAISRNTLNLFNVLVNVLSSEMFWLFCCSNWPLIMSPSGLNCLLPALQMHRTFKIKTSDGDFARNQFGFTMSVGFWPAGWVKVMRFWSRSPTWERYERVTMVVHEFGSFSVFWFKLYHFEGTILNSPSRFIYILVCWFSSVVPILAAWMVE